MAAVSRATIDRQRQSFVYSVLLPDLFDESGAPRYADEHETLSLLLHTAMHQSTLSDASSPHLPHPPPAVQAATSQGWQPARRLWGARRARADARRQPAWRRRAIRTSRVCAARAGASQSRLWTKRWRRRIRQRRLVQTLPASRRHGVVALRRFTLTTFGIKSHLPILEALRTQPRRQGS